MLCKRIIFTLTFVFISFFSFGQVSFKVVSKEDSSPVPNVLLIEKSEGKGVVSNKEGIFNLPESALVKEADFTLSGIGFEDLIINSKEISQGKIFYLNPRVIELDDFTITAEKLESVYLGDTISPFGGLNPIRTDNPEKLTTVSYVSYLDFKDNRDRIISNVWVYFGGSFGKNSKIRFRWFISNEVRKPKKDKIYSSNDFFDASKTTVIYEIENIDAWNKFDFLQEEIVIPKGYKGCFMVIDVMPDEYGEMTPIVIPFQNTKGNQVRPALYFGSGRGIGIFGFYGGFAMMVEYLK
ncbi:hypothetical protein [Belliella pelovolcani]|uniref:hypothetical protein n=1 Tax=Belliella pelovolcani TaxID=529505 RepID=UPI00391BFCE6